MIKFFDIKKQDKKFHNKILSKINNIISNSTFIDGKEVSLFEEKFKRFCNVKHCITVGNGTDALLIALKSLNLKRTLKQLSCNDMEINCLAPLT